MNAHVSKTQEVASKSAQNAETQLESGGESTFQFVDNRPEAVAQRKLQEAANNSPQVKQLMSLQSRVNSSLRVSQQRPIQNSVSTNPQMQQTAQLQTVANSHSAHETVQLEGEKAQTSDVITEPPSVMGVGSDEAQTSDVMTQPPSVMGVESESDLSVTETMSPEEIEKQVNELMKNAQIAAEDFKALITRVKDASGAENGDPTFEYVTKKTAGAITKAKKRMAGKTTAGLTDVVRGTLICNDMEIFDKVQKLLDKESVSVYEIIGGKTQKKNGFAKRAGDMVGYGDMKYIMPIIHFNDSKKVDFWMYAEIQVMSKGMGEKKTGGGHSFYDVMRMAKLNGDTGMYHIPITEDGSAQKGAAALIGDQIHLLKKGVNPGTLETLIPKLKLLASGDPIDISKKEYDEMEFAGDVVYVKERLEGNLIAHAAKPKRAAT